MSSLARPPARRIQTLFAGMRAQAPSAVLAGFSPSAPTLTQLATGNASYGPDDFQAIGSTWLIEHHRGVLRDDAGLGKTKMTLDAINHLRGSLGRILVLAEASNINDPWIDECKQWYPDIPVHVHRGKGRIPAFEAFDERYTFVTRIIIASYAIFREEYQYICKHYYDWCILDEGQMIRGNPLNGNMSYIAERVHFIQAARKHILSGTPLVSSPADGWNIMRWLGYEDRSWKDFMRECLHVIEIEVAQGEFRNKVVNATPAGIGKMRSFMYHNTLQRTKKDHLVLPPKTERQIAVRMSVSEAKAYLEVVDQYRAMCEELEGGSQPSVRPEVLQIRMLKRCTDIKSKLDVVEQKVKEAIGSDQKVFVVCTRLSTLRLLYKRLRKYGITYLHGGMSAQQQEQQTTRFGTSSKHNVLIATQQCCRTGRNKLKVANVMIRLAREWNPSWNEQTVARLHRAGQSKPVLVLDLYAVLPNGRATIEHKVERALQRKSHNNDMILHGRVTPRVVQEMLNL
jgi:SNF2 family DNA or RNA helicase